ncbi:hypothetical protein C2S52_010053 [Perilla frutescens var. hirtella]|nr:hypothetical protein C2S52_010053 [Perilla frutescens var. hirtella]
MSSATETLCGQAFGAKQYHMMGIYLQRSWLIDLITLIVLLPAFIFGTQIFNLLGQEEEEIAKSAGYISLWFIPFVASLIFGLTVQMYLQAQQKNIIIAWLSALQFVIHILCSWLFVYVLDFGLAGAMPALCISSWFLVFGEFVYIFGDMERVQCGCSEGLVASSETLNIICLELWYYAILVLLAGYMKNAQVAMSAFSICLNINGWILMIILGMMGAAWCGCRIRHADEGRHYQFGLLLWHWTANWRCSWICAASSSAGDMARTHMWSYNSDIFTQLLDLENKLGSSDKDKQSCGDANA